MTGAEYAAKWRKNNREKYLAYRNRYYDEHKEEINAKRREQRALNKKERNRMTPDECAKRKRESAHNYYMQNREACLARSKSWADKHQEEIKEYKRQWYQKKKAQSPKRTSRFVLSNE